MDSGPATRRDPAAEGPQSLEAWRESILGSIVWIVLGILVVAALLAARELDQGQTLMVSMVVAGAGVVSIAAVARRLDPRLRILLCATGLGIGCLGPAVQAGFLLPNAFAGLLALEVMLALLAGQRAAWVGFGLVMLALSVVAAGWIQGGGVPEATTYDVTLTANWVRVMIVFTIMSAALIGTVSHLTHKLEAALLHSQSLFAELRDESSQKIRALEEQQQLTEQLRHSQKLESLGHLAGGVAHDFNNLLSVILGYSEVAEEHAKDSEVRSSLAEITGAAERAGQLTHQLLTFSRHRVAVSSRVDVNASVRSSLQLTRRLLPPEIEVDLDLRPDVGHVWGAGIEIEQVLMNLCINARDAMQGSGHLRIRTDRVDEDGASWIRIEVGDDGAGMSKEMVDRIFEPFFSTKDEMSGTGLGLSVVHGIVTSYGGRIDVESHPGAGTTFTVRLPRHLEAAAAPAQRSTPPFRRPAEGTTILVVDDDESIRRLVGRLLERAGHRVLLCSDGEEALARYDECAADVSLVVTDSVMPRMGGAALHEELRKRNPSLPLLMCSGYTTGRLSSAFFDHPLRDFLPKPFTEHDLLERVEGLLAFSSEQTPSRPA